MQRHYTLKLRADNQNINEQALAITQEALRESANAARYADYIENSVFRDIIKAGARLKDEELVRLKKLMEVLYPEAFESLH